MIALSAKPAETSKVSRASLFRSEINKAEEEKKERENSFSRLQVYIRLFPHIMR
jgi:hypothetical protein